MSRRIGLAMMVLLASAIVVAPRHARAEPGAVVVGGSADDHTRTTVGAAFEAAARGAGWSLAVRQLSASESERLLRCSDPAPWTCIPTSLESAGVRRVLVVKVDAMSSETGTPMHALLARLIVADPQTVVVNRRDCEHCARDRIEQESTSLARDLLKQFAVQAGRTILEVDSLPGGAEIVLDAVPSGVTPGSFNTFPGDHVVVIEKAGYRSVRQPITLLEGKTARISVTLDALDAVDAPRPSSRSTRTAKLVTAAGVLSVAAGIALWLVDGDDDPQGASTYWDTAPAGIALGLTGVAATGVGLYLWRSSTRAPAVSAAVVSGGVVAQWQGRF